MSALKRRQARLRSILNVPRARAQVAASVYITTVLPAPIAPIPSGTLLRVTNERNGKQVVVRVTDRGPHGRGRIIDLSYRAARELGILAQGVAVVRVERVHTSKIPFKPEKETLPELDFEVTEYTLPEDGVFHFNETK